MVSVVVIGRNEGKHCLLCFSRRPPPRYEWIYVDSLPRWQYRIALKHGAKVYSLKRILTPPRPTMCRAFGSCGQVDSISTGIWFCERSLLHFWTILKKKRQICRQRQPALSEKPAAVYRSGRRCCFRRDNVCIPARFSGKEGPGPDRHYTGRCFILAEGGSAGRKLEPGRITARGD